MLEDFSDLRVSERTSGARERVLSGQRGRQASDPRGRNGSDGSVMKR
jgi:hypothetical protein